MLLTEEAFKHHNSLQCYKIEQENRKLATEIAEAKADNEYERQKEEGEV